MNVEALRCTACHGSLAQKGSAVSCVTCARRYTVEEGSIDFLESPSPEVIQELKGLAVENGIDPGDDYSSVKWMRHRPQTLGQLMAGSRDAPVTYYQQTFSAFLEGLSRAQLDSGMDVLEIGSSRTHPMLMVIKDLCASAFALNIFFHVPQDDESARSVTRVLADMCELPFADEALDLVIVSATLHHSPDIGQTLRGIRRVLRPGGRAIVVNEPVEGRAKRLGSSQGHDRHALIHEDPVSWSTWTRSIKSSGLRADHFVPAWFVQRVAHSPALPLGTRFRPVAQAVRPLLAHPALGDLARFTARVPGQRILGLPLNAVLWRAD